MILTCVLIMIQQLQPAALFMFSMGGKADANFKWASEDRRTAVRQVESRELTSSSASIFEAALVLEAHRRLGISR